MKRLFTLLLMLCPLLMMAQTTRQIKGQILNRTDGIPIVGATIFIDPASNVAKNYNPQGTISGADGRFSFVLPVGVKDVVVSFLGYETLKLPLTNNDNYIIRLAPSTTMLDEVVVTGYQQIEKRKLTSSIATVNMDALARTATASVDQMLEGQLAGVFSTPTSGAPGSGAKVRIRTAVTLSGTDDPLWVLDGMPLEGNEIPRDWNTKESIDNLRTMSIAGINPDDIQDITVLKDAAATAIYGARAANGVIIITTKKGRLNEKMRINVTGSVFITERPNLSKLNLMDANEKVDWELSMASNKSLDCQKSMGQVARILDRNGGADRTNLIAGQPLSEEGQKMIDALRTSGSDWSGMIYRPTVNQQYGLSIAGGGAKAAYYFSAGYYNEQGTTRGTGFDRINLTLKTDFEIIKNLRFGVSMFGTAINNKSYITDANGFSNPSNYTRRVNPYLDAYNPDGSYMYDADMVAYQKNNNETLPFNFIEESTNTKYGLKTKSFKSIFDLEYKIIKQLRIFSQLGLQVDNSEMERFADQQTYFVRKYQKDKLSSEISSIPEGGIVRNSNTNDFQYNWKLQAEYRQNFNNVHEVNVMGGLEMRAFTNTGITTQGFGYDPNTLTTKPIIFTNSSDGQKAALSEKYRQYAKAFYENRFLSYYATASYSYDNRYTVFGSMRYDGTNLFGVDPEYKFTPLWSISAAWNMNREKWLKNVSWLSNLKLRASYGVQGNIDKNTSPYVTGVWQNTTIGSVNESHIVANLPNRYLRWETTKNWNAAIDAAFFNDRLMFTFEAYRRVSDNLITPERIAQENGFEFTSSNFGKMTGDGLELSINSVNISTKSFRWTSMFNISTNKTTVNQINYEPDPFSPSRQGLSSSALFGFRTAGMDKDGLPLMLDKSGKAVSMRDFFGGETQDTGYGYYYISFDRTDKRMKDLQTYLGDAMPKYTGGFINSFRYNNFDLTIGMNFVIDQMIQTTPFYNPVGTNPGLNITRNALNIFNNGKGRYPTLLPTAPSGDMTEAPPTDAQFASLIFENSPIDIFSKLDIWTKSMSYLRINSIRLGYTLPAHISKKMHMNSMRVSFETRNPFVFSNGYKGYFDPENYGNIYSQPLSRIYSLGLSMTF